MSVKNSLTKNRNSSIIGVGVACNKSGKLIGRYVSGVMHQRAPLILSGKGSFCVPNKIKSTWPTLHQKIRQQKNRFDERSQLGTGKSNRHIITQILESVKAKFCVTFLTAKTSKLALAFK